MAKNLIWLAFTTVLLLKGSDCLHCLRCSNMTEDDDCQQVAHCLSNQNCYTERYVHGNETKFTMGCIDNQRCPARHDLAIVGRRSKPNHCLECCLTDGCNRELCEVPHVTGVFSNRTCADDPGTNCTRLSTVANICTDIQHAKTICRKYCGLCDLVDGGWSDWSDWPPCSTSCGIGLHTRSKTCTNPVPKQGGENCTGKDTQTHSCFSRDCPDFTCCPKWTQCRNQRP